MQSSRQNLKNFNFKKVKNYKILNETKILHQKKKDLSKNQILEHSILFIIINYSNIALKKIEELSNLIFSSTENEQFKNRMISLILKNTDKSEAISQITFDNERIIDEINQNSNIQLTTNKKNDQEILELLNELILELKGLNNLKKIESLEKELINNLDENSFSELIKLKSQLNRE